MAEVQKQDQAGEMERRFVEFVMMQAHHASICLGRVPLPGGKAEKNLEYARLLIDQLQMIREKTRGNLGADEAGVLNSTLSSLQLAYVEEAESGTAGAAAAAAPQAEPAQDAPAAPAADASEPPGEGGAGGKRKFYKSFG